MSLEQDVQQLRILVAELTRRVYRLEQRLGTEAQDIPAKEPEPATAIPPHMEATPSRPQPPAPAVSEGASARSYADISRIGVAGADSSGLEQKIGSQWLNRIGIIAVLIGVSYFLKYAFESGWIGPAGRVAIGLLAGIAIVFWSERFRAKSYVLFSYSLKAVGIGVLYLSLWAAFQLYHLIPSGVAFAAMVLVTAATTVMALTQDAEVLAALALVGGFLTPALVSTGENHEIVLFSYVALLDVAAVALISRRPWRRLLTGSFAGTLLMYIGWYSAFYTRDQLGTTLFFATLFMVIFAVAPLVIDTRAATSPQGTQLLLFISLLNAATYFLQIMVMFDEPSLREYRAWVAVGLAAFYLLVSRMLGAKIQRENEDHLNRVFPLLHIGIAVGLLTVAIPLKLSGHWITFGWFVEAGILFWIGERTRMTFLKILALTSLGLALIRLLTIDNWQTEMLIINERFALYLVAIAVLGFMVALERNRIEDPTTRSLVGVGVVLINVLAVVALCWEVDAYWDRMMAQARGVAGQRPDWRELRALRTARDFSYSAVWMFYGAALMIVGFWKKMPFLRWQAIALIAITIVKVFVYDVSALDRVYRILSFLVLGAILLAISFLYQRDYLKLNVRAETDR